MKLLIRAELRRVLPLRLFALFICVVALFSAVYAYCSSYRYQSIGVQGPVSGYEIIRLCRKGGVRIPLTAEGIQSLTEGQGDPLLTAAVEDLAEVCFGYRNLETLTDEARGAFYDVRVEQIAQALNSPRYTDQERAQILEKAARLPVPLTLGYAEGWKRLVLYSDSFLTLLLIAIGLVLLPFFGHNEQDGMDLLCRASKKGTTALNHARMLAAFLAALALYAAGVALYTAIQLLFYGAGGGDSPIQVCAALFTSAESLSLMQAYGRTLLMGLAATLFVSALSLLFSIVTKSFMMSVSATAFFWVLLYSLKQMVLYPVDHFFGNFMPLCMTQAARLLTGNELYHVLGRTLDAGVWTPAVSLFLTLFLSALCGLIADVSVEGKKIRRAKKAPANP